MDIVSIEWGIALFLLFAVPIIYIIRSQTQKEKKAVKTIEKLYRAKGIKISDSEILNSQFIGVDKINGYLVFAPIPVKEEDVTLVHIKNVARAEVSSSGNSKSLDYVALQLTFKDQSKKELVLFNEDIGMDAQMSRHQANQWKATINNLL